MIILITGASHTGKTALAQKLLEKYKYPYLSIDHLKMGLIRSGNTKLTPKDDDKLTEYLWPIVREDLRHPPAGFCDEGGLRLGCGRSRSEKEDGLLEGRVPDL